MKSNALYCQVHNYSLLISRWRKLSKILGLKMTKMLTFDGYPVYEVRSPCINQTQGIYLSAGIHGDEAGAVEGLTQWAEKKLERFKSLPLIIYPCLNPWGLKNNSRYSQNGEDLNRKWGGGTSHPLSFTIQERIAKMSFRVAINLHEDYDANGVYLYQLSRGQKLKNVGNEILESCGKFIDRDSRNFIEGRKAHNGILRPRPRNFAAHELPEALYLFRNHTHFSCTLETPSEFDLEARVAAHIKMIDTALKS